MTDQPNHKAGFVNIIGNPNVGKSTLMNQLVGENLSIITAKAQTTRHRIKGIVNGDDFQIVYSDLPGLLNPTYKMQEMMMRFVKEAMKDADVILYLIEPGEKNFNEEVVGKLALVEIPLILVINKIDKGNAEVLAETKAMWTAMLPNAETIEISALQGLNLNVLLEKIKEKLPYSPPYFPKNELTDKPVRFFISEIIREKILLLYRKEIPYSVEIVVESYKEEESIVRIAATIYCERDTQKGILIGNKGSAIKQLGIEARKDIEDFIEKPIFLDLSIKVLKDWRNQELLMKRFGYYN